MAKASKIASLTLLMVLVAAFPGAMVAVAAGGTAPVAVTAVCPASLADQLTANSGILHAGEGMTATATFTVAAGCATQVTLVSYKAPSATFSFDSASEQVLFDSATASGAGAHTLSVHVPTCFFQVDLVFGAAIVHLGPAGSGNFYSAQGRLIQGINAGTTACVETPPTEETPPVVVITPPVVVVTPPVVVVTAPTVTVTPPPTVIPAGPITWATGFGPNGVVASVQTAPTTTTTTTTATTRPVAVAGVASLPSTSTAADNGLVALGIMSCVAGLLLLGRRPARAHETVNN